MDYAGGPAGLTTIAIVTCDLCGWTGKGRDLPVHYCPPRQDADDACPYCRNRYGYCVECDPETAWK